MRASFRKKLFGRSKPPKHESPPTTSSAQLAVSSSPPGSASKTDSISARLRKCAACGGDVDTGLIECPHCGSGRFASEKAHAPTGAPEVRPTGTSAGPAGDFSEFRLVMALSRAIQQKFKDYPPEMAAAIFLAMTDKNRADLVERPEGIYISRRCWEKMLSYDVWLAADGQIIITTKGLGKKLEEPKEEAKRFLNTQLPSARRLGRMNSLHYAIGLALTFGLDQSRLVLQDNQSEVEIYY